MKTAEEIKLKWQKHNRDNGMSWNEVAELVNEVSGFYRKKHDKSTLNRDKVDAILYDCFRFSDHYGESAKKASDALCSLSLPTHNVIDFKPMSECNGFNMKRLLLKNKNSYIITGYYKDGMILPDGDEQWTNPQAWDSFILLEDLTKSLSLPTLSEGEIQDKLGEYARRINKEYNYYSVRERSRMIDGYEAALKELTKPKEER
jgi:hypothetical protein